MQSQYNTQAFQMNWDNQLNYHAMPAKDDINYRHQKQQCHRNESRMPQPLLLTPLPLDNELHPLEHASSMPLDYSSMTMFDNPYFILDDNNILLTDSLSQSHNVSPVFSNSSHNHHEEESGGNTMAISPLIFSQEQLFMGPDHQSEEEWENKKKKNKRGKHTVPKRRRHTDASTYPSLKSSHSNNTTHCTNCKTGNTPLWRRNPQGQPLCNACGLFLKLHGTVRPLSLKTDVIKKRNRSGSQKDTLDAKTARRPCRRRQSTKCQKQDTESVGSSSSSSDTYEDEQLPNHLAALSAKGHSLLDNMYHFSAANSGTDFIADHYGDHLFTDSLIRTNNETAFDFFL
ncbi:hypothetical protein CU098_011728 [Rhizopus stolonifer]|uniref:GATA-type domain-containing protein n=2 Tax=Mucorineae TaxID=1344963 RepID=A0A367KLY7_RHIST|nr:hypothetical protein CU098_011728 [Rhizopus stolonifer]